MFVPGRVEPVGLAMYVKIIVFDADGLAYRIPPRAMGIYSVDWDYEDVLYRLFHALEGERLMDELGSEVFFFEQARERELTTKPYTYFDMFAHRMHHVNCPLDVWRMYVQPGGAQAFAENPVFLVFRLRYGAVWREHYLWNN